MSARDPRIRGLYLVTAGEDDTDALCRRVEACLQAGVRLVQYRDKTAGPARREQQARALVSLCRAHGAALIVNDDPALAARIGADGVHLGQGDAAPAEARRQLGPAAIVGVSCHESLALAREAVAAGASYVAFGAVYPSATKPNAPRVSLATLHTARRRLDRPIVAIGGILPAHVPGLAAAGVDAVAVVGGLARCADPAAVARTYLAGFASAGEPIPES
ncbi:MAG: thiamine phosphate synthase [Pseudomonadota bacterium]|nr:thiamine phosphate synthase [Pseudomonadota bacterium]